MVLILVSVAFFIVLERKGLGMVQKRHGPNKVGFKGIFQPVSDGIKLFSKEVIVPSSVVRKELFFLGPIVCFFCAFRLWVVFPRSGSGISYEMRIFFFLCLSSVRVYGVFLVG